MTRTARDLSPDGSTSTWTGRALIGIGRWSLDEELPPAVVSDPDAYLTMQFTGQKDGKGGPYRGEQDGKRLRTLRLAPPTNNDPGAGAGTGTGDDPGECGGVNEDECGNDNA